MGLVLFSTGWRLIEEVEVSSQPKEDLDFGFSIFLNTRA